MKNNETGETELVLGNRQLLLGFFVIVVLFALFFAMGYIVGRNSGPPVQASASHDTAGSVPATSTSRPQPVTGSAPQNPPAASEPARQEPAADPAASAAPPAKTDAKAEPTAPVAPTPATTEPAPSDNYLQAYSGKQEVAETVANTLREKGFPTLLSPGPQGKTRVLIGPYPDAAKLGQAKADLERLGFAPFRQKIEK